MPQYDFVRILEELTHPTFQERLGELRRMPKGSHTDSILQEALLDSDYDEQKLEQLVESLKPVWMFDSFPDLNNFRNISGGIVVRSEFLLLRYLGDKKFDFRQSLSRQEREDLGIQNTSQNMTSDYLNFLSRRIIWHLPKNVIFRLCDYDPEDLGFLEGPSKSRGAARLIEQEELLRLDLDVVRIISNYSNNRKKVDVLVPYVVFPEEFGIIKKNVKAKLGGDTGVGCMLEVPINLFEEQKYSDADFFVFGPGDLCRNLYGGIDRNSPIIGSVNSDVVIPMVKDCLARMDSQQKSKNEKTKIYMPKNLAGKNLGNFGNLELIGLYTPSQVIYWARK